MFKQNYLSTILILFIYFILGFYLLPFFQYQINGDGTALIAIAKAVNMHAIKDAINAYWGTAFSVFLAPFLINSIQPIYSFKLFNLVIGVIGLVSFINLLAKLNTQRIIFWISSILSIPIFIYFAFFILTADLFMLTLFLIYLNLIFSKRYLEFSGLGILIGSVGGLLVLSKEYFLYYFLAQFCLFNFLSFFYVPKEKRINIITNFLLGTLIFLTVLMSWAFILQSKYGRFIFGLRGEINNGLTTPEFKEYPMFTDGLFPPSSIYGYSVWEEPERLGLKRWNPLSSDENLKHQLKLVTTNFDLLNTFHNQFSVFFYPLSLISIIFLIFRRRFFTDDFYATNILLILVTFPLGYLAYSIESRYIWIDYTMMLILSAYVLSQISKLSKSNLSTALVCLLSFFIILSFAITPVKFLKNYRYIDHTFFDQAKILKGFGVSNKKIASNTNWHQVLYISVYNNNQFFGLPERSSTYLQIKQELEENRVEYFLIWSDINLSTQFQKDYLTKSVPGIQGLDIVDMQKHLR